MTSFAITRQIAVRLDLAKTNVCCAKVIDDMLVRVHHIKSNQVKGLISRNMMSQRIMLTRIKCVKRILLMPFLFAAQLSGQEWKASRQFNAREAHQAAAADHDFVYAITNDQVAKFNRKSLDFIGKSQGEAHHLNSGFFWKRHLYCAHSNSALYDEGSERSQIKLLDVETMQLTTFKDFGDYGGSLTWAVFHEGHWWCNFARYSDENAKTFLARFIVDEDDQWREQGLSLIHI